jgi:hypothetical protein
MCKAELLQTLAVEATTSALRHGAAQINNFAPLSQAFASDAARKFAMAQTACDTKLRSHDGTSKREMMLP